MKRQYNFALKELIKGNINLRYSGNYLWIVWSIMSPLLLTAVVSMLFSKVAGMAVKNYPLYYLAGHIVFVFFASIVNQCITAISDNAGAYDSTLLPKGIFIYSRIISGLILAALSLLSYPVLMVAYGVMPTLKALWSIPALLLVVMFAAGIGCVFAVLEVFGKNIKRLSEMLMVVMFLASCIFYPITSLNPDVQRVMLYNPIFIAVNIVRTSVIYGSSPQVMEWVKLGSFAVGSILVGVIVFVANKDRILKAV